MGGVLPRAERRGGALIALYVALSLLLLIVGERFPQSALREVGSWLFTPLDRAALAIDRAVAAWSENRQLHERLAQLELENTRLRSADLENAQLRSLLGFAQARSAQLIPAEIVALSGEASPSSATLDVGRNRGVKAGDVVMTREGLLGRVGEVYAFSSRAVLLTDLNNAVACEIESTGVQGVLRFDLRPRPRLVLTVDPFADTVTVGQRVLTSGLSRRYPRGIAVGSVARVARDPGALTLEIEVMPAARFTRLRHAFVMPHEAERASP
jgi:rod shape-determining protein MreC